MNLLFMQRRPCLDIWAPRAFILEGLFFIRGSGRICPRPRVCACPSVYGTTYAGADKQICGYIEPYIGVYINRYKDIDN